MITPSSNDKLIAKLWLDLIEKDDRTSPEEYPDMALITEDEFIYCLKQIYNAAITECTEAISEHWQADDGSGRIEKTRDCLDLSDVQETIRALVKE